MPNKSYIKFNNFVELAKKAKKILGNIIPCGKLFPSTFFPITYNTLLTYIL